MRPMPVSARSNAKAIDRLRGPSARFASLGMTEYNKKAIPRLRDRLWKSNREELALRKD
jgi:hypothetical protein